MQCEGETDGDRWSECQVKAGKHMFRLFSLGHTYVYITICTVIVKALSGPCRRLVTWWHSVIKDEKYLIGQELQNSVEVSGVTLICSDLTDSLCTY
jgi:hypothetical protein